MTWNCGALWDRRTETNPGKLWARWRETTLTAARKLWMILKTEKIHFGQGRGNGMRILICFAMALLLNLGFVSKSMADSDAPVLSVQEVSQKVEDAQDSVDDVQMRL